MAKMIRMQLLTSADAQPFRRQHKSPCMDCPWTRGSMKGWIGSNTIEEWLAVARDYWFPIACHTRKVSVEALRVGPMVEAYRRVGDACAGHWECAGAAIYRANTHVLPFSNQPWLILPPNRIRVFAAPAEFVNHHREIK